jgi:hypothetical protein
MVQGKLRINPHDLRGLRTRLLRATCQDIGRREKDMSREVIGKRAIC